MKIYMLSDYLKENFGCKLYKLILSSGFTCPNRDGTCGKNGCIFCSDKGSGEFAQSADLTIEEQIENAKKNVSSLSGQYIAYFQSFSNTYATAQEIKSIYMPVVLRDDVAILSIATRPDCISNDIINVLKELNAIKPVWVELGLQTIHNNTANFIRRGYPLSVYTEAITSLRQVGINVITHLILGLPFESKQDMIESAKFAGELSDGLKFHSLYISKCTDLEKLYKDNKIKLLSKEEYIDILCDCIRVIPKDAVIHRLTGDPDKSTLVAPEWSSDKIKLLRDINNALYDRNVIQGESL